MFIQIPSRISRSLRARSILFINPSQDSHKLTAARLLGSLAQAAASVYRKKLAQILDPALNLICRASKNGPEEDQNLLKIKFGFFQERRKGNR